jgi:hypothetical protein
MWSGLQPVGDSWFGNLVMPGVGRVDACGNSDLDLVRRVGCGHF